MTARPFSPLVRIALFLAFGAVATPICGAAPRAPEAASSPAAVRADSAVRQQWMQTLNLGEAESPLMAQLGAGAMVDVAPLLLSGASDSLSTSFPSPTAQATRRDDTAMGLPLPEPGPLSAIIATVALAGFFFVRRAS